MGIRVAQYRDLQPVRHFADACFGRDRRVRRMDLDRVRRKPFEINVDLVPEAEGMSQRHVSVIGADEGMQVRVEPIGRFQLWILQAEDDKILALARDLDPAENTERSKGPVQCIQSFSGNEPVMVGNKDGIQPGSDGGADLFMLAGSAAWGAFAGVNVQVYFDDGGSGGRGFRIFHSRP